MRQNPSDSQAKPSSQKSGNAARGAAGANFRGIDAVASRVADKIGLSFPDSRRQAVAGAIRRVMARRHIDDARLLLDQIGARQDLTDELVNEVTVGETCFFRGPVQFQLVRQTILPELRRRQAAGAQIRIWSAGCATGRSPIPLPFSVNRMGFRARLASPRPTSPEGRSPTPKWRITANGLSGIRTGTSRTGISGDTGGGSCSREN